MQKQIRQILKALEVDINSVKKAEIKNKKLLVVFIDGHKAKFIINKNYGKRIYLL